MKLSERLLILNKLSSQKRKKKRKKKTCIFHLDLDEVVEISISIIEGNTPKIEEATRPLLSSYLRSATYFVPTISDRLLCARSDLDSLAPLKNNFSSRFAKY